MFADEKNPTPCMKAFSKWCEENGKGTGGRLPTAEWQSFRDGWHACSEQQTEQVAA